MTEWFRLIGQLSYFENEYGWLNQVIIPVIGGAVACWLRFFFMVTSMDGETKKYKDHKKLWHSNLFILLAMGGLAGIVAVNLLNPGATFAQSLTISVLAGLSGITYLFKNSMESSHYENKLLNSFKVNKLEKLTQNANKIDEKLENDTPEEVAKAIRRYYNIDKMVDHSSNRVNEEQRGEEE